MKALIQFIKFSLVGLSNTIVHYLVYLICTFLGLHYMFANFCAFTISVLNSFYWNNKYVFKEQNTGQRYWVQVLVKTYIAYGITGLLLSSILLYVEIDLCDINELIAPILNLCITTPLNFIINKFWAYREKEKADS